MDPNRNMLLAGDMGRALANRLWRRRNWRKLRRKKASEKRKEDPPT